MIEENKTFIKTTREELITKVHEINQQIHDTDALLGDIDRDNLREIRKKIIDTVDVINHMEYKELI